MKMNGFVRNGGLVGLLASVLLRMGSSVSAQQRAGARPSAVEYRLYVGAAGGVGYRLLADGFMAAGAEAGTAFTHCSFRGAS